MKEKITIAIVAIIVTLGLVHTYNFYKFRSGLILHESRLVTLEQNVGAIINFINSNKQ